MTEVLNPRTSRDLEFVKALEGVAQFAACSLGAEAVRSLTPSADRSWILREMSLVKEMEEAVRGGFSPGPIHDLRPLIGEAKERGILDPSQFLPIAETLEAAAQVRQALDFPRHPGLSGLARRLDDHTALLTKIWRAIDDQGAIREDATPKLRTLVAEQRRLAQEIQDLLRRFLDRHRDQVQDAVVTQRGGRFVIPLKTGARALGVVVHEASGSGQTLFAEPAEAVALNNRLREIGDEIDREKHRIMSELTASFLAEAEGIERDLGILARLDSLYARARYAQSLAASFPSLAEDGKVELVEARHPLLGSRAVPLSLSFGGDKPVVVITGPNTGGKTVTLKTIGLLTAMVQAGIPIPASPRSALPVFQRIRSDIGEEQSLEQSLSTFSSHMKNIIEILGETDEETLVLLDELGAGTDPQEGAALGLAILERLLELGATVAVATHLTPVKLFAISHPRILSCSMEFDLDTLSPTFRVLQGVPGRSCALLVAERLGLPKEIVERAKGELTAEEIRAEEIIEELSREKTAARRIRANLEIELGAARKVREEYEKRLQALREKRKEALGRDLLRLEGELEKARKELSQLIAQARAAETAEERREILRKVEEIEAKIPSAPPDIPSEPAGELLPGDAVQVKSSGAIGRVLRVLGERIEVEVRGRRVEVSISQVERVKAPSPEPQASPPLPIPQTVSLEISVRGLPVEEAKRQVDSWLDRLLLAGIHSGRIIHGKGTGTLRQALHDHLRQLPFVSGFHLAPPEEGGEGVTVVELG